jgi:hypothetical protein
VPLHARVAQPERTRPAGPAAVPHVRLTQCSPLLVHFLATLAVLATTPLPTTPHAFLARRGTTRTRL